MSQERALLSWFLSQCRYVPSELRDERRRHVNGGKNRGGRHLGLRWTFIFAAFETTTGQPQNTRKRSIQYIRTHWLSMADTIFKLNLKQDDYERANGQSSMASL